MHNLNQAFANPKLILEEGYQAPEHFLILGLGESGVAMAKWCQRNGAIIRLADTRARQQLSEQQKAWLGELEFAGLKDIHFGPLDESLLNNIDVIGISPGLSPLHEPAQTFLTKAHDLSIDIWGEIEFFARGIAALDRMAQFENAQYKPSILAVTGTNGKTTTTALTGRLCERAGKKVAVAGNIGPAALDQLISSLEASDQISDMPDIWVLELSSFQLVYTSSFHASAAAVLNISQDHLDWHGDMQAYMDAKANIFGVDTTYILNRDDVLVMGLISEEQKSNKSVITFGAGTTNFTAIGMLCKIYDKTLPSLIYCGMFKVDRKVQLEAEERFKTCKFVTFPHFDGFFNDQKLTGCILFRDARRFN